MLASNQYIGLIFFVLPWISRMLRRQKNTKIFQASFARLYDKSNGCKLFRLICYMSRVVFFRFRKSSHVSRNVCSKAGRSNQLNAQQILMKSVLLVKPTTVLHLLKNICFFSFFDDSDKLLKGNTVQSRFSDTFGLRKNCR